MDTETAKTGVAVLRFRIRVNPCNPWLEDQRSGAISGSSNARNAIVMAT
jgi:hypothetical protein